MGPSDEIELVGQPSCHQGPAVKPPLHPSIEAWTGGFPGKEELPLPAPLQQGKDPVHLPRCSLGFPSLLGHPCSTIAEACPLQAVLPPEGVIHPGQHLDAQIPFSGGNCLAGVDGSKGHPRCSEGF